MFDKNVKTLVKVRNVPELSKKKKKKLIFLSNWIIWLIRSNYKSWCFGGNEISRIYGEYK
jgi:hypothetical protein